MSARLSFATRLALLSTLTLALPAAARDDMSGTWKEDFTETVYSVEQWSPTCGKRPVSTGKRKRGLTFKVEDRSIDLKFTGKGRSFSTGGCQTSNKAVRAKERTVKDKLFMISCSTAEDSPTYESGFYSFRVNSPKKISYKETTRFSRNISGSMCVHTKRIRRTYTKTADKAASAPKPEPKPEPKPKPKPEPEPKPADSCAQPGAAVSVSFEPTRAELAPGKKVCIQVEASDANACEIKTTLGWGPGEQPATVTLTPAGCLVISKQAKAGKYTLHLQAAGLDEDFQLTIKRRVVARTPDKEIEPQPEPVPEPVPEPEPEPEPVVEEAPAEPDAGPVALDPIDAGPAVEADAGAPERPAPVLPAPPSQTAKAEGLPSWVLPAGIGAGFVLLLVIGLLIFKARAKPEPQQVAKQSNQGQVSIEEAERSFGLDIPAEQAPVQEQRAAARTLVEPLRAVQGQALDEDQEPTMPPEAADDEPATQPPPEQTTEPSQAQADREVDPPGALESFCTECGEAMPAEAEFCTGCGHHLEPPSEPEMPEEPASAPEETEPEKTFCTECGEGLPQGAHFCPFCQTKQD